MHSTLACTALSHEAPVIAAACRSAGRAFLEGARNGWSKPELDRWLLDQYAPITVRLDGDDDELSPESALRASGVAELIELIGVAVTEALRSLAFDPRGVIDAALSAGAIVAISHDDGQLWMPVDRPDLDLETRVLSLFASDYLLNPEAYEDDLSVCPCCDRVSFDAFGQCPRCSSAESGLRRLDSILDEVEAKARTGTRGR